jgi:hypothetical protein
MVEVSMFTVFLYLTLYVPIKRFGIVNGTSVSSNSPNITSSASPGTVIGGA